MEIIREINMNSSIFLHINYIKKVLNYGLISEDQKLAEMEIEDKCKVCGEICTCEANQNTLNRRSQVEKTEQISLEVEI